MDVITNMRGLQPIASALSDKFLEGPIDDRTIAEAQAWLNETYTEVTWDVYIEDIEAGWRMIINPNFPSAEFETYWKLKYL